MKPFPTLRLALTLMGAILAVGSAHATITVLDYWHMGENDPGAVSGGQCITTVDAVGGKILTNSSAGGFFPIYTNGVSSSASAETGSTLALALTNGQFGTGALATSAADNFGIECWVNPGTNSGSHVLAYNGIRSTGWGLYLAGTNFEVLYGGEITFGNAPATPNAWTHLALVRSGGVAILYINGVPAATNSATAPIAPSGSFTVGGDAQFPAEDYTGLIDEVRVFTFAPGAFSPSDLLLNSTNVFVSNTGDNGAGSLRAAVASAPNGATITFATNLSGQTILLTGGQITLDNNVTIDGSALTNGIAISGNHASRIFDVSGGTVVLNSLTITNGTDAGNGGGGGMLDYATLTLNNCTLAGNTASDPSWGGGGILSYFATLTLNNCTLTGNSADNSNEGGGGGLYILGGTVVVNQSTLAGNSADNSVGGGGILNSESTLTVTNSIVAANTATGDNGPDIYNFGGNITFGGANLVQTAPYNDFGSVNGTYITAAPLLARLGNYGGPTPTMPPLAGSPAIDAGDDSAASQFATDQRGYPRLAGAHVDIGAVEVNPNTIVTTAADNVSGSLRNVIAGALPNDLVSFAPVLSGQTILLTGGQLELSSSVTIDGSALANGIVVNGNNQSRVFQVDSGATVGLNSLTIVHGNDNGGGGAGINNSGTLTINNSTLADNIASGYGGGIENGGVLTLNQTTLTGNTSPGFAGGSGIDGESSTIVINQSTITGNTETSAGGAVLNYGGALTVNNSIIAGNSGGDIAYGFSSSLTLLGTNLTSGNPLLAPLGNYGGPTPTMPPLAGSPAIDAGDDSAASQFATDQRGYPRLAGAHVDIGAVEVNPNTIVTTAADNVSGSLRNVIAGALPNDLVSFAPVLSGQTILLTGGQLELSSSVTIDGSALANGIVVNGNNQSRVFQVERCDGRVELADHRPRE